MWLVSTLYERNLFYQQLNLKYGMLKYVHSKIWRVKKCRQNSGAPCLLLVLFYSLDFIFGIALAVAVAFYPNFRLQVEEILSAYTLKMLDLIEGYLNWVMGIPWGIKLNTPVNHFLGSHYLYVLSFWRLFYMEFIAIYMSYIIKLFLLLLPFGFTLPLTALHDFLKFLNLCLICFFVISQRISTLQVSALKSLGRLFMGKKWNILKDRVDTCHYDLNQLLVGTIIFTVLLFLVPTTGMYTLVFLYLRVLQFTIQFLLRISVVLLNKATLYFILNFYATVLKKPVTHARVLINGVEPHQYVQTKPSALFEGGTSYDLKVCTFSANDVKIVWNGSEHSISEMKEVIDGMPLSEIADELAPSFQCGLDNDPTEYTVTSHSMLCWLGTHS